MPKVTKLSQGGTSAGLILDPTGPAETIEPASTAGPTPEVPGPTGRLTFNGKPVKRLFADLGKDYTIVIPPRATGLNWGSCIESQIDCKDVPGVGYWTRPVSLTEAIVHATADIITITWADSPITTVIRLGLGATVAYE